MVIITTGNFAEPLEITLKICDNINERSARYVIGLSDGVPAPFEDRSLCFLKDKYRIYVLFCQ